MRTSEVQRELEQLRKEVAALSAARKQNESSASAQEDENVPPAAGSGEEEHAFKEQIEELIKVLQEEVRGMPAVTTLAVFALGILMGRHLR